MKPTPLSALLADDLLLDRVGARLDADDQLGSLLLAVAHQADTPIPRAAPARRRRPHRGLTVLAALGVAVSGATVAAAVELAPVPPDQASSAPHLRGGLQRSLQALVLPFLAGTPFQGRLALPFGVPPAGPLTAGLTAEGLSAADPSSVYPMGDPIVVGFPTSAEELHGLGSEKTQGKGTPNAGTTLTDPSESGTDQGNQGDEGNQNNQGTQGNQGSQGIQGSQGTQGNEGNEDSEPAEPASQPKPTPTPTTTIVPPTTTNNGATGNANGQNTGHNGQGDGRDPGGSRAGTGTTGTTSGTTTGTTTTDSTSGTTTGGATPDGTLVDRAWGKDDPASRVPPKGKNRVRVQPQPAVSGVAPIGTTAGVTTGTTTGTTGSATSPAAP